MKDKDYGLLAHQITSTLVSDVIGNGDHAGTLSSNLSRFLPEITGMWFSFIYVFYYGMTFLQTAATRKISGLFIITFSLAVLIPAGLVHWPVALSMFAGGGLGAWVSARYARKLSNGAIRYLFLAVMFAMAAKILLF